MVGKVGGWDEMGGGRGEEGRGGGGGGGGMGGRGGEAEDRSQLIGV